ncbi:MAG: Lysine-arginine-ornithine-binding periplasmic protein precursor [Microvirga sp.]|jgi:polar amino acid transport system substrate-binding protein|nr:Lysine-arginine-ornithine-binding periplasmic protein precursor [Microvirga sp.]
MISMFRANGNRLLRTTLTLSLLAAAPVAASAQNLGLINEGVLSAGSDLIYPPYNYLEAGEAKGFDADLLDLIAPHMGVKVKFADTRFASLIPGLRSRRFDIIASALYVTQERAKVIDYVSYAKSGASLIVRTEADFSPQKAEDLCGKRVGSQQGAAWIPDLQKVSRACPSGSITIREFGTSAEAGQALISGGVDVQIVDAGVGRAGVDNSGGRLRIASNGLLYPIVIGFGVSKDNPALFKSLQSGLDAVDAGGKLQPLLDRYNLAKPTQAEIDASLGKV